MMPGASNGGTYVLSAPELVEQATKSQLSALTSPVASSMHSPTRTHRLALSPPSSTTTPTRTRGSISPRRQAFAARELDPLLGNLSPMATIEALKVSNVVHGDVDGRHRLLVESIAGVSPAERALGIRASVAAKKLREWFNEVHAWEWPKKFDPPSIDELREKARPSHHGSLDQAVALDLSSQETWDVEYWGSLPAKTVEDHERRLEDIQDEMEAFDMAELKSYVRMAHSIPDNGSSISLSSTQHAASIATAYKRLDDFTMVITATIMQALPYLSRLSTLIDRWSTRLAVLRRVPRFLIQLEGAQKAMDDANSAISGERESDLRRNAYLTMKDVVEKRTMAVAETLDSLLDLLEGHADGLPDCWIDDMEAIETDYQDWVADAEDVVMANELHALKSANITPLSDLPSPRFPDNLLPTIEEPEDESNAEMETVQAPRLARPATPTPPEEEEEEEDQAAPNDLLAVPHDDEGTTSDLTDNEDYSDIEVVTAGQIQVVNGSDSVSQAPSLRPSLTHIPSSKSPSHRSAKSSAVPSPMLLRTPGPATTSSRSGPPTFGSGRSKGSGDDYFKLPVKDQPLPVYEKADEADDEETQDEDENDHEHNYSGLERHRTTSEDLSDSQWQDRKSSSDDTNSRSFRTTTTFERTGGVRSRASTPNTYAAWSDQSESEEEGGLKSYGNANIVSKLQEFEESKRASHAYGKHKRSLSTDDFFTSIIQPLASPALPIHEVIDEDEEEEHYGQPSLRKQSLDIRPILPSTPTLKSHKRSTSTLSKLTRSLSRSSLRPAKQQRKPPPPPLPLSRPPSSQQQPMSRASKSPNSVMMTPPPRSSSFAFRSTSPAGQLPPASPVRTNTAISIDEQIAERISNLLTRLPAPIQLMSGPGSDAVSIPPTPTTPLDPRTALHSNPVPAKPAGPIMKLAPAHSPAQHTVASRSGQSEVKLYHLTRNGGAPIKLYVRLVGEHGGRVMVRVGGGWSDLGEYLRDYAAHHGRSATMGPDGNGAAFEVHDLPVAGGGGGSTYSTPRLHEQKSRGSMRSSRPTTPSPATLPVHAKEYVSRARRHVSAGPCLNGADGVNNSSTNIPAGARPSTAGAGLHGAAAMQQSEEPTSDGAESTYSAFIRREHAHVYGGQPRRRPATPTQDPLGPAGPAGRPKDISPKKAAWVEGVLSQARKISGGGGGPSAAAPATKRVFLKKSGFTRKT